jgi:hypothetical protein
MPDPAAAQHGGSSGFADIKLIRRMLFIYVFTGQ